MEYSIKVNLME